MEHTFKGKVIVTEDNAKVGMYVQRGRDWIWDEQDCVKGKPSVGKIISEPFYNTDDQMFWVRVKWENNNTDVYRVDIDESDLVFAEKTIINYL